MRWGNFAIKALRHDFGRRFLKLVDATLLEDTVMLQLKQNLDDKYFSYLDAASNILHELEAEKGMTVGQIIFNAIEEERKEGISRENSLELELQQLLNQ